MSITLDQMEEAGNPRDNQSQEIHKLFFQACLNMHAVGVELVQIRDDKERLLDVISKLSPCKRGG